MEAFNVFATFSLVDLLSSPLESIRKHIEGTNVATASLSTRMGNLASAMAPVALGAGALLSVFGICTMKAAAFESAMADVAKVIDFSGDEFAIMSSEVKNLAGRIPMAADGIAAIIAAAGQSGVAKESLTEFAEQAAKMGVAFDLTGSQAGKMMADWRAGMNLTLPSVYALADSVNHLSNNMNATAPALGEVIQRVGAAAMACGLGETQVAALGAAFLSAGASPEVAATALKKFTTTLVKGAAMTDNQAKAFQSLSLSATQMAKDMQTDAQGTIFKVLEALADKPKEVQISLLTQMFGEEAIGAIAPLLQNMSNLSNAFELVGSQANYARSMQGEFDARSKTTANAVQLMQNRLSNLASSVGAVFLPAVTSMAHGVGRVADALRLIVDNPFGQWLLRLLGIIATVIIGVTAFSAALWVWSIVSAAVVKGLLPIKAAILGLSWPIWLVIGAVTLLYVAYRKNFGGIADAVDSFFSRFSLLVKGIVALFNSLTGSSFAIRGELAKDIKVAGLEKLLVTVSRVIFGIKKLFRTMWEVLHVEEGITFVSSLFDSLSDGIGDAFSIIFRVVGVLILNIVRAFDSFISALRMVVAIFRGDWASAMSMVQRIWNNMCTSFMAFADLFAIGDWIRNAWNDASTYLSSLNLFESGAKLLDTFIAGIASKVTAVKDTVMGGLSAVRNLLPFSDAKEGPLSTLTLSGERLMSTIGDGVLGGAQSLKHSVSTALGSVGDGMQGALQGTSTNGFVPTIPAAPSFNSDAVNQKQHTNSSDNSGNSITIHIGSIELPHVTNGEDFLEALQESILEYTGDYSGVTP